MNEAVPEVSIYSDTIARFIEKINSKYSMTLNFLCV